MARIPGSPVRTARAVVFLLPYLLAAGGAFIGVSDLQAHRMTAVPALAVTAVGIAWIFLRRQRAARGASARSVGRRQTF